MADYVSLSAGAGDGGAVGASQTTTRVDTAPRRPRIASLDVFRGLSIALMIFVDYAGSILPAVGHSPWNGVRLADFVMPFFLFIAGISVSLVYKRSSNKIQATQKAMLRAVKLFILGILLQVDQSLCTLMGRVMKTGGLVIWRSGRSIVLYRGTTYQLPCVQTYSKSANADSDEINAVMGESCNDSTSSAVNPLSSSRNKSEGFQGDSDIDNLLNELGPRFKDWTGRSPLPVDVDLLPAVVPDYKTPFRLLPYKTRNALKDREMTALRRLARTMPPHFALGGYFHGVNSLSYGVDIEKIRWLGILQRIAVGYITAALCEIWFSRSTTANVKYWATKNYCLQWIVAIMLCVIHSTLLYSMHVPDWQFKVDQAPFNSTLGTDYVLKTVKCDVRGDLGPACNAAGMIDRGILGIQHLYKKPVYRNLMECRGFDDGKTLGTPSWCEAPFDPEGILSSLTAAVSCILGLHFGHILSRFEDHKDRLMNWLLFSLSIMAIGAFSNFMGIPLNKSLYTISYMLLTTGSAGFTFCVLYISVDVYEYRFPTMVLEWMGKHSLSIFILVASNIAVVVIQGFYWKSPQNNIVHLIISLLQ